jgi:hypothetical protein
MSKLPGGLQDFPKLILRSRTTSIVLHRQINYDSTYRYGQYLEIGIHTDHLSPHVYLANQALPLI